MMNEMARDAYLRRIDEAAVAIGAACPEKPEILLILGSGLGAMAEKVSQPVILPYEQIPGFPRSTVFGHAGQLILGKWGSRQIAVMQGRFHYYEGHTMTDIVLPIRIMRRLGVRLVILTNAAGGLGADMHPGDLMQISDHVSLWAESPLRGANLDDFGPRFPDMSSVYDPELGTLAHACAAELGFNLQKGVYGYCKGPQFETPAEIALLRQLGISAVGMSTVPEAIVAAHCGLRVFGLSCITNLAAGLANHKLSHDEVMLVGAQTSARTIGLLSLLLDRLPADRL